MQPQHDRIPRGTRTRRRRPPRADTRAPLAPTYPGKEIAVLKKARSHASLIVVSSLELYRELTLSALSLVRRD